jgi:Fe2+ transport system protein FeoA
MIMRFSINKGDNDLGVMESSITVPLAALRVGETGMVTELAGEAADVAELGAMGICAGTELTCLRSGVPCIVQYGGTRLCLRPAARLKIRITRMADRE